MPESGPCFGGLPASNSFGPQIDVYIGGGPQTMIFVVGAGGGRYFATISGDTKPVRPPQPDAAASTQ